ncbi:unnamed protein product [Ixodes pacificus]
MWQSFFECCTSMFLVFLNEFATDKNERNLRFSGVVFFSQLLPT